MHCCSRPQRAPAGENVDKEIHGHCVFRSVNSSKQSGLTATKGSLTSELRMAAPNDDEWQRLATALGPASRFATAAWIRAWGKCFLPYQDWSAPMRYLTVRATDGQLRAIFPFAIQTKLGMSVASLAGFYWPFRAPIIPDRYGSDVFEALATAFTHSSRTLAFRYGPVPDADPGIAGLNAALESLGWRVHRLVLGETYSVKLPDTWQEFENRLGKNLKTNTYYYERRMRREGELEIRCTRGLTDASWAETVRNLGIIEGRSWQRRTGGQPRFFGERNQVFWTLLLAESGFGSLASAWVMYFRGEPVSFCFCLDCADIRHIVANSYAEHVDRYSTGSILYRHVFRDAVESGVIRRVNIGMGDSGYKSRWNARPSFQLVDWIACRPGARGRLLDLALRLRQNLRKQDVGDPIATADRLSPSGQ